MSTEDAIGFIRPHKRISEKVQRAALTEDGVRGFIDNRDDIERMACAGRVFKVRHLFLFAEPRARKRIGWRKDLLAFLGRIEKKGAVIKDVDMGLTTEKPEHRYAMVALAIEQLSNNGRVMHLNKKRTGRKPTAFSAEQLRDFKAVWRDCKEYPTWDAVRNAYINMDEKFTVARAYRLWGPRT